MEYTYDYLDRKLEDFKLLSFSRTDGESYLIWRPANHNDRITVMRFGDEIKTEYYDVYSDGTVERWEEC